MNSISFFIVPGQSFSHQVTSSYLNISFIATLAVYLSINFFVSSRQVTYHFTFLLGKLISKIYSFHFIVHHFFVASASRFNLSVIVCFIFSFLFLYFTISKLQAISHILNFFLSIISFSYPFKQFFTLVNFDIELK